MYEDEESESFGLGIGPGHLEKGVDLAYCGDVFRHEGLKLGV
jgi:hypothetical protein